MRDKDDGETEFHIRVDGGEEQTITVHTSVYKHAVMAAYGLLKLPFPCDVEIWVPELVKAGYGPYHYRIDNFVDTWGNGYGLPCIMTIIRSRENGDA